MHADQHPRLQPALHARMDKRQEHEPGTLAPATGHYEELNVFGTPTGRVEHLPEGEWLPHGPRGFTWRRVEEDGCSPSAFVQIDPPHDGNLAAKGRPKTPPHRGLDADPLRRQQLAQSRLAKPAASASASSLRSR